jgi:hypothetical protein
LKEGNAMTVKFNQYWRINRRKPRNMKIRAGQVHSGSQSTGIHIVAGWVVLVGGYSEILCEGSPPT